MRQRHSPPAPGRWLGHTCNHLEAFLPHSLLHRRHGSGSALVLLHWVVAQQQPPLSKPRSCLGERNLCRFASAVVGLHAFVLHCQQARRPSWYDSSCARLRRRLGAGANLSNIAGVTSWRRSATRSIIRSLFEAVERPHSSPLPSPHETSLHEYSWPCSQTGTRAAECRAAAGSRWKGRLAAAGRRCPQRLRAGNCASLRPADHSLLPQMGHCIAVLDACFNAMPGF